MTNKKIVICNLIGFALLHLMLEVMLKDPQPYAHVSSAPVVWQFFISYWIIQRKMDTIKSKTDLIVYTWVVSVCVLAVRILLGVIFGMTLFGLFGKAF